MYLDTDVLLLRPLPPEALGGFIGHQGFGCLNGSVVDRLNGAVMGAAAGHPWLLLLIRAVIRTYTAHEAYAVGTWGAVGPDLLTRETEAANWTARLHVFPRHAFQPLALGVDVRACFQRGGLSSTSRSARHLQTASAVHANSAVTGELMPENGSLCQNLFANALVLPKPYAHIHVNARVPADTRSENFNITSAYLCAR